MNSVHLFLIDICFKIMLVFLLEFLLLSISAVFGCQPAGQHERLTAIPPGYYRQPPKYVCSDYWNADQQHRCKMKIELSGQKAHFNPRTGNTYSKGPGVDLSKNWRTWPARKQPWQAKPAMFMMKKNKIVSQQRQRPTEQMMDSAMGRSFNVKPDPFEVLMADQPPQMRAMAEKQQAAAPSIWVARKKNPSRPGDVDFQSPSDRSSSTSSKDYVYIVERPDVLVSTTKAPSAYFHVFDNPSKHTPSDEELLMYLQAKIEAKNKQKGVRSRESLWEHAGNDVELLKRRFLDTLQSDEPYRIENPAMTEEEHQQQQRSTYVEMEMTTMATSTTTEMEVMIFNDNEYYDSPLKVIRTEKKSLHKRLQKPNMFVAPWLCDRSDC